MDNTPCTFDSLVDDVILYLAQLSGEYVHRLLSMTSRRMASLLGDLRRVPMIDPIMQRLIVLYPDRALHRVKPRWRVYEGGHRRFVRNWYKSFDIDLGAVAYNFEPNLKTLWKQLNDRDMLMAWAVNGDDKRIWRISRRNGPMLTARRILEVAMEYARSSWRAGFLALDVWLRDVGLNDQICRISLGDIAECYDPLMFGWLSKVFELHYFDFVPIPVNLKSFHKVDDRLVQILFRTSWRRELALGFEIPRIETIVTFVNCLWEHDAYYISPATILSSNNLDLMQWAHKKGLFAKPRLPTYSDLERPTVAVLDFMETTIGVAYTNPELEHLSKWGENDAAVFDWIYVRWPPYNVASKKIGGIKRVLRHLVNNGDVKLIRCFMDHGHWETIRAKMIKPKTMFCRNQGHYELVALALTWSENPLSVEEARSFLDAFYEEVP